MLDKSTPPSTDNAYHLLHAKLLLESFARLTGEPLLSPDNSNTDLGKRLYEADFVIVSHGVENDPVFNYANKTALTLFEMNWTEFVELPSRFSAEPLHQTERARLMETVSSQGYITNYAGVRISKSGRRFMIENATVWNLLDDDGVYHGQAATFSAWKMIV